MKVIIIPLVIGAFCTVTKGLLKGLEDLEVGGRVETIQITALLRTARILRRVLETWGDLLSLNLQWNAISLRWYEKLYWVMMIIMIIIPRPCLRIEKTMEHAGDNYTNCNWCVWNSNLRFTKGTGGLVSWQPSRDHPKYCIILNGQNTEKSPGDFRRLAVTQTPVKNHQLTLMWKTLMIIVLVLVNTNVNGGI